MVIGGVEELHFVILLFQHDLQKYVMKNLKLACCVCCNYKVGRYLKKSNGGTTVFENANSLKKRSPSKRMYVCQILC